MRIPWLWERWYLILPGLVFLFGELQNVSFERSLKIFLLSFSGLIIIDVALEGIIFSLKKLVRAWHLTFLVAASTNLPEFAIATTSFLKGDPLDVAPNVALGSNFANVGLGFLALLCAFLVRSIGSSSNAVTFFKLDHVLTSLKQIIFAIFLSFIAVAYFEALKSSVSLSFWVVGVLVVMAFYYLQNFHSHGGKKASLISQISHHELDEILANVTTSNPLVDFLQFVDDFLHNHSAVELEQIANADEVKKLQMSTFNDIHAWEKTIPKKHRKIVSEILEHFEIYSHLPNLNRSRFFVILIMGLIGIGLGAYMLDNSADLLARDFGLQKGLVAFFILSFLTSAGEFLTSYKFFLQNKHRDGWRNIADSNLSNLVITLVILVLHFFTILYGAVVL